MAAPRSICLLLLTLLACPALVAATAEEGEYQPRLFDTAARLLSEELYQDTLPEGHVDQVIERYRPQFQEVSSVVEERALLFDLLAQIPLSHLGLVSADAAEGLLAELSGEPEPSLGFKLVRYPDGGFYVDYLMEGGPGEQAGLLRHHRVLSIDGVPPQDSPRLGWRTDDAALPDPPVHGLKASLGEVVQFEIEKIDPETGERSSIDIPVTVALHSTLDSARTSIETFPLTEGTDPDAAGCLGYVHFWYVYISGMRELLLEGMEGPFAQCEALLLDLRGRGGSAMIVFAILNLFEGENAVWHRPVVALFDRNSRSAKDMLAYEMKERGIATLVGERTAGAVLPASFLAIDDDHVLMMPTMALYSHSKLLEGNGVEPDVAVEVEVPVVPGSDPIFERGLQVTRELAAAHE